VLNPLTIIAECHHSERRVILWLNRILCCLLKIFLNSFSQVCHTNLTIVLLSSANKLQGDLFIWTDDTAQWESREHALCHLFADFSRRNKVVLLVGALFVLEVSETLQEFELKMGGLWTVIHQECWVFSAFPHVNRAKVERALYATPFVEHNREGLFDAGGAHLHNFVVFLARAVHSNFLTQIFRLGSSHPNGDGDDLIGFNIKLRRLN
jgi:hypothetical protein